MEYTKIYPSVDELKTVNSSLTCTEEGCNGIFTSESNLTLHLAKTHQKHFEFNTDINKQYYCPNEGCMYQEEKFFKTFKLLKQHFLKVHADKLFKCENCNKGFATFNYKNRHRDYCGVNFSCCDCELSYPSYESLLTHSRRKSHKILAKGAYNGQNTASISKCNSGPDVKALQRGILPKSSKSVQVLNVLPIIVKAMPMPVSDKSSQTETCCELPEVKSKHTQVIKNVSEHSSKQSQTLLFRKFCSSAETQTNSAYACKKAKLSNLSIDNKPSILDYAVTLKDIKTQTNLIESSTKSCNTSFDFEGMDMVYSAARSSSSTQTNAIPTEVLYSTSTSTHDSTHTDTSDLNYEAMHSSSQTCFDDDMSLFDSYSFFNCNNETQTDLMLDTNLLSYDDSYSNIHTQTNDSLSLGDEIMPLDDTCQKRYDDLLFNTIDTQTVLDDIARSVESQTMMHSFLTCRDMTNMETQTDIDFKILLEEINA